jgi:glyceraldehyde 3-phosphate dehydrogenase
MSKVKVAINGFGRIGRSAYKILHARDDVEVVAINDLAENDMLAHLLKHDSNYPGHDWYESIEATEHGIKIDGKEMLVFSEKDPGSLPWAAHDIDVVIESTGLFVKPELAKAHVEGSGAKKVVISAPAKGEGSETIILGVNDDKIAAVGDVVSNASCTTNCITPVMAVLETAFGVESAMMTTVHSYTSDQRLQDAPHKDRRRARAAAENIIPTTTGATVAAGKAMPTLEGIFDGMAIRVPTSVVSLSDFTLVTKKKVTVEAVNEVFKKAASEPYYQGILGVTEEELVSSDFIGNSHSTIVDLKLTKVVNGNLLKVVAWYDNEWGYSNRLVELTVDLGKALKK